MKLKKLSQKQCKTKAKKEEKKEPTVYDIIKLVKNLVYDIQLFEDEFEDKDYPGIITPRTDKRLKKLLPGLHKELEIK